MFKLFNFFRKKPVEIKLKSGIEWFDLLEYGVIRQIEGVTATIYYMDPPSSWEDLYGREAIVLK